MSYYDDEEPEADSGCLWKIIGVVVALLILLGVTCAAFGGEILVSGAAYGAKPNDSKDDTAGLQKALDKADGDSILIRKGVYYAHDLAISSAKSWEIDAEPGAVIVWSGGTTGAMLTVTSVHDTDSRKRISNLTLIGPQVRTAPAKIGGLVGLRLSNAHSTILDGLRIHGFDRAGLELIQSYRVEVRSLDVKFNGVGALCDGANATTFINLVSMYNRVGYQNIQSLVGGNVEGNVEDGGRYTELGIRASVHDVWFEQNAQIAGGFADISANSLIDWRPDATQGHGQSWRPVVLSVSGSTTFHNPYSTVRPFPAYTLAGCLDLVTSGALRLFDRNFHLHPWSKVRDNAAGNSLTDTELPGPGFDGPVQMIGANP